MVANVCIFGETCNDKAPLNRPWDKKTGKRNYFARLFGMYVKDS